MAKIGLAAELAKQAAQAAREEIAAASGTPVAAKAAVGWSVPVLAQDFQLDPALGRATQQVMGYYRQVLATEGLHVELGRPETKPSGAAPVAGERQEMPHLQALLREQGTGRVVRAYTTPALLAMFATQQQVNGVVVDGQV